MGRNISLMFLCVVCRDFLSMKFDSRESFLKFVEQMCRICTVCVLNLPTRCLTLSDRFYITTRCLFNKQNVFAREWQTDILKRKCAFFHSFCLNNTYCVWPDSGLQERFPMFLFSSLCIIQKPPYRLVPDVSKKLFIHIKALAVRLLIEQVQMRSTGGLWRCSFIFQTHLLHLRCQTPSAIFGTLCGKML